jgi:hypothetical protein
MVSVEKHDGNGIGITDEGDLRHCRVVVPAGRLGSVRWFALPRGCIVERDVREGISEELVNFLHRLEIARCQRLPLVLSGGGDQEILMSSP